MAKLEKKYILALVEFSSDLGEDKVDININGKDPARAAIVSFPINMEHAGKMRIFREVVKVMEEKHERTIIA